MIQGVSAGGSVGVIAATAVHYAQMDGKSLILPVRPAQMINASFKHIQMRPDSRLQDGVPLYKLKILDTLIEQFSRTQAAVPAAVSGAAAGAGTAAQSSVSFSAPHADNVDAIIASVSERLRGSGASYRVGFLPEPGAFVNLLA